jgi:serine/threonine protein kinase
LQAFARKVLHVGGFLGTTEEWQNELRAIKKLCQPGAHPNIIEVLRFSELKNSPYYFIDMELCDMTLWDYIYRDAPDLIPRFIKDRSSSLKEQQIWNVMRQVVSGVEFIHHHKEVHRDLKPQNSILSISLK